MAVRMGVDLELTADGLPVRIMDLTVDAVVLAVLIIRIPGRHEITVAQSYR